MGAQGETLSKVYGKASLDALRYFEIAYSSRESVLSTLRREDDEFGTMLKILEQGGTKYANYLESIVKPLEEAGFLSCNYVDGYCKVTDEGIKAFNTFNSAARRLDMILGVVDELSIKAINEKYVIPESIKRMEHIIDPRLPFIPTGNTNPFIEAFIRAKGELRDFILQIVSLYHPLAFLLTAKHIIKYYETEYENYVFTCKDPYERPIRGEKFEEILRSKARYPTGEEINEILENYTKIHNIPNLESALQVLSMHGLIKNLKNKEVCTCGEVKHYNDDRYELTEHGRNLAEWIALHILLS